MIFFFVKAKKHVFRMSYRMVKSCFIFIQKKTETKKINYTPGFAIPARDARGSSFNETT